MCWVTVTPEKNNGLDWRKKCLDFENLNDYQLSNFLIIGKT